MTIHPHDEALRIVAPYLPKNPVVLEGGAYDGRDTVRMATFWPGGTIHSFEPVPQLYRRTKKNVAAHDNVTVYDRALGGEVGKTTFHISEEAGEPGVPSRSGSLLPPKDHGKFWPNILFKKQIEVSVTTIDRWAEANGVAKVDFLWLDIQGSELIAMRAAPRIMKTVKAIVAEVEFVELYRGQELFWEIRGWLKKRGFTLIAADIDPKTPGFSMVAPGADPTSKVSKKVFGNVIFVRK